MDNFRDNNTSYDIDGLYKLDVSLFSDEAEASFSKGTLHV